MILEEGTPCTVDGCENKGLLGEVRMIDGLKMVIAWCGPHLIERRHAMEPASAGNGEQAP